MRTEFVHRTFQLWEYHVSHGSLLIRSPRDARHAKNVDLICTGVEYMALARHIKGIVLVEPTAEEITSLSEALGRDFAPDRIRMIVSEGRRSPIIAAGFSFSENEGDIFDSPFETQET